MPLFPNKMLFRSSPAYQFVRPLLDKIGDASECLLMGHLGDRQGATTNVTVVNNIFQANGAGCRLRIVKQYATNSAMHSGNSGSRIFDIITALYAGGVWVQSQNRGLAVFSLLASFAATTGLSIFTGCMLMNEEGSELATQDKHKDAIAKYDTAIKLWTSGHVFRKRGWSHHKLGDNEKALADLNKSIEMKGGNSASYKDRASVYKKLGKPDLADADLAKAKQLDERKVPGLEVLIPEKSESELDEESMSTEK